VDGGSAGGGTIEKPSERLRWCQWEVKGCTGHERRMKTKKGTTYKNLRVKRGRCYALCSDGLDAKDMLSLVKHCQKTLLKCYKRLLRIA